MPNGGASPLSTGSAVGDAADACGVSFAAPTIELRMRPCYATATWPLFAPYHYLDASINHAARAFVVTWRGRVVAFESRLPFPGRGRKHTYREHRREACVVESLRMRAILLRPLRKALGVSIVEEDGDWSRVAGRVTKDDWEESTELERDFTMVDW